MIQTGIDVPDTRSRNHLCAFWRGVQAACAGQHQNPYRDLRCGRYGQIVTGARGYRKFWQRGHDEAVRVNASDAPNAALTGGETVPSNGVVGQEVK